MVATKTRSAAGAPISPSERAIADAVDTFRSALRRRDLDAMQAVRWLAPRPPGERDLLSDLAAAEGIELAVRKLSSFWRKAEVRLERVRVVDAVEAEVYERVSLPGEALPIVTLVRRPAPDAPWRVVCTNEAHDERFIIWLTSVRDDIDDVEWSRAFEERFGTGAELIMDGATGVLGDPGHGWLSHVRAPLTPREWPDMLPGEGGKIIELATALTPSPDDRIAQLTWVLETATICLAHAGGPAAYFPLHEKVVLARALDAAADGAMTPDQTVRFWARIEELDGFVATSGLRQLALPEIEAPVQLGDLGPRLVMWLAAKIVEDGAVPARGTDLVLGDRTFVIAAGRRGPRRGKSYGRWGALRIASNDASTERPPSRTRIRIPDHLG